MRVVPLGGIAVTAANVVGAAVVFVFLAWVVPLPSVADDGSALRTNALVLAATGAIGLPIGVVWSRRRSERALRWLREDRTPEPAEVYSTLRIPLRVAIVQVTLWVAAGVVFFVLNLQYGHKLAIAVFITILLGAAVTVALAYLLLERICGRSPSERSPPTCPTSRRFPASPSASCSRGRRGPPRRCSAWRCWRVRNGAGSATCRPTGSAVRCSSSPASGS
jgi:hypothetical protein